MFKRLEEMVKSIVGKPRCGRDDIIDDKKLYAPYVGTGKYLAITYDRSKIVAAEDDPMEAQENAINAGYRNKFAIERAPDTWPRPLLILATA